MIDTGRTGRKEGEGDPEAASGKDEFTWDMGRAEPRGSQAKSSSRRYTREAEGQEKGQVWEKKVFKTHRLPKGSATVDVDKIRVGQSAGSRPRAL